MSAIFNSNRNIMIIYCYSPTNASDQTNIITFYNGLSYLVRYIRKHSTLIISGDKNAQIGKDENNKFGLHNLPNRNGEFPIDFSLKITLSCLNIKFLKRERKLWIHTNPNSAKPQLVYVLINKK